MFLFDPTFGASFENCEGEIGRILGRAGAEILLCRKWDERRLAYRIKDRKRGVYALTFFKADPPRVKGIERDAQLSEHVLRILVLNAEGLTREAMERAGTHVATEERDADRPRRGFGPPRGAGRPPGRPAMAGADDSRAPETLERVEPAEAESSVAD